MRCKYEKQGKEKITGNCFQGRQTDSGNSGYRRNRSDSPNLPEDLRALDDLYIYPGLGFKSGVILNIKNDFFISAELSPQILYKYYSHERITNSELRKERTTGFDLNLNNESVRISLIYRWTKM